MISVRRCSVAELEAAPNLGELLAEYAAESALPELGAPAPQVAIYRKLEEAGVLRPVAAFEGDRLLGFISPLCSVLPHYGVVAATVESFFVPRALRKKGIGLELLAEAELVAQVAGARALFLSAPAGGSLARVLDRRGGYRLSNVVHVKALA